MSIITLTSDFGMKDFSIAAVKGSLLNTIDKLTIIDISHEVTPYCIPEAAYILNAAFPNFPKNSIHIIAVDSAYSPEKKHIVAKIDGHYFIGADNGIFSLLANEKKIEKIITIEHPKSENSPFPTLDIFVEIATKIISKEKLENLGSPTEKVKNWVRNQPNIAGENELIGHIIYIDTYGNIITDISKGLFNEFSKNRPFVISASSAKLTKIYPSYNSFVDYSLPKENRKRAGSAMAIFNSLNFLEIALYKSNPKQGGSAASLLGLCVGSSVKIVFE